MDEPGTSLFLKCLARLARQTQALATLRGMVGGEDPAAGRCRAR